MVGKTMSQHLIETFVLFLLTASFLIPFSSPLSQETERTMAMGELERSFQAFLQEYRHEMKRRNGVYLMSVHPKLPEEMYDFFFDVTQQMMQFSEDQDLEPTIECQEFKVCKVVYPQPNDSWAAQRFILHEGAWRWLDQ